MDFSRWGGSVQRGCDPSPSTGYAALQNAGFPVQGTRHDGPGFICRISNLPPVADEPCNVTPPASKYWSYWHADAGQSSWSYSQLGAMSYRPKAGSVDAWVYGATDLGGSTGGPGFSPAQVRAADAAPTPPPAAEPAPTPPPAAPPVAGNPAAPPVGATPPAGGSATTPGATTGGATTSGSPTGGATTGGATTGGATTSGSPTGGATTGSANGTPSASASGSGSAPAGDSLPPGSTTSGPRITEVKPVSATTDSIGSARPMFLGMALVAALGGAAALAAWRRRQQAG